jgi:hypothetical protein
MVIRAMFGHSRRGRLVQRCLAWIVVALANSFRHIA